MSPQWPCRTFCRPHCSGGRFHPTFFPSSLTSDLHGGYGPPSPTGSLLSVSHTSVTLNKILAYLIPFKCLFLRRPVLRQCTTPNVEDSLVQPASVNWGLDSFLFVFKFHTKRLEALQWSSLFVFSPLWQLRWLVSCLS